MSESDQRAHLESYLKMNFGIEIFHRKLVDLLGFLITNPMKFGKSLIVADWASEQQRLYLTADSAVHILLGHVDRPFKTIFEPREFSPTPSIRLTPDEINKHLQANILTYGILDGGVDGHWDTIWDCIREYGIPDSVIVEDVRSEAQEISRILHS